MKINYIQDAFQVVEFKMANFFLFLCIIYFFLKDGTKSSMLEAKKLEFFVFIFQFRHLFD